MSATTDHTSPPPELLPHPLRLCLKPSGDAPGLLDGAWWPHSRDLRRELPALTDVLDLRWGRITRIAVNPQLWPVLPRKVPVTGHVVKTGWFAAELDPHKLLLLSGHTGRWDLLVIPPGTAPATARRLMSAATDQHVCATASALVEAEEGRHGATPEPARIGPVRPEQAWEDEGGAFSRSIVAPSPYAGIAEAR